MQKRKLYICAAGIVALAFIIIFSVLPTDENPQTTPVKLAPQHPLNNLISNEDSDVEELKGLDKAMERYLEKWSMKGASLAITRNDSLVYAKGYGWADEEKGIRMQPGHILRVASVSKLITAIGIMTLQDKGLLDIKDQVFGSKGILKDSLFRQVIKDSTYHKITVEHLLRHQGGFYRDPVFSSRDVKHQMQLDNPPTKEDYYRLVLRRKVRYKPGTFTKYSNFGYLLLSEIIEKVSGMKYEDYIHNHVLVPAGCYDMHIAENYYEAKRDNEVRYYTHEGDGKFIEEYNDSGNIVERCYGGSDIKLLSGAGAWCCSTIELARLIACIDADPTIPDILSDEAIRQMTEPIDNSTYSLGWNDTNPKTGWSRSGTLAGTCAYIKHFPDGECWIMVSNTSSWKGPSQAKYTDALFKKCRKLFSHKLPAKNLFE